MRMRDNLERAMAQILATDERMLGRMGLDIHDGPTQQLSVALLEVQLLEADIADAAEARAAAARVAAPALGRIYETVGGALHEMRELIGHLRPAQFEDRRLTDILGRRARGLRGAGRLPRSTSEFEGEFPVNGVSITQRITLYRILQETLSNAQRHGHARERARARARGRARRHAGGDATTAPGSTPSRRAAPQARACPWRASVCTACATGRRSWAAPSTP